MVPKGWWVGPSTKGSCFGGGHLPASLTTSGEAHSNQDGKGAGATWARHTQGGVRGLGWLPCPTPSPEGKTPGQVHTPVIKITYCPTWLTGGALVLKLCPGAEGKKLYGSRRARWPGRAQPGPPAAAGAGLAPRPPRAPRPDVTAHGQWAAEPHRCHGWKFPGGDGGGSVSPARSVAQPWRSVVGLLLALFLRPVPEVRAPPS